MSAPRHACAATAPQLSIRAVAIIAALLLLVCVGTASGFEVTLLVIPSYQLIEQSYLVHVTHNATTGVYTLLYDAHNVVRVWSSSSGRPDQVERTIAQRTEEYTDLSPFGVGVHTISSDVLESHPAQYESFDVGSADVVSADDLPPVDPEGPGLTAADVQDDIIVATPETLVRYEYLVLLDAEDDAAAGITDAAAGVDESTNVGNEEAAGDPVLVASGMFTTSEIDLALSAGAVAVIAERVHRSDLGLGGSLGSAWWLSFDTRIVFGESRQAAQVQAVAAANTVAILSTDVGSLAAIYSASRSIIMGSLGAARAQLADARRTYDALALFKLTYHGDHREIVIGEINRQLFIAGRHVAECESITGRFELHLANLVSGYGTSTTGALGALHDAAAEHQAAADEYGLQAGRAEAHAIRNNRFVPGAPGPEEPFINDGRVVQDARAAGNDSVTLIDAEGVPHRFVYAGAADPAGGHTYTDGSPNYFPAGTNLQPEMPTDDTLRLTPDGQLVLTRKGGSRWVYGIYGQLLRIEDRNGNWAAFEYDDEEQLYRITDSRSREVVLERNQSGLLTGIHAPQETHIRYTYGPTGELASVTDPAGDTVRYEYSGTRIVRTTKPDGSFREYSYSQVRGAVRATMTTDEEGNAETFDFSSTGRTVHTSPTGITTVFQFDGDRRVSRIDHDGGNEFPGGLYELFAYNGAGDMTYRRATDGSEYRYTYDARHNPLRVDYPDMTAEAWTYNVFDLPANSTDRRGLSTDYHYDGAGNLTRVNHVDGTADVFTYHPPGTPEAGSVATHTNRRGNLLTYTYDERGFTSTISDSIGLVGRYEHDVLGRVVGYEDGVGNRTSYTYTPDGWPDTVTGPEGYFIDYDYDERKDLVRVAANGRVATFGYDDRHLMTRATNALGESMIFGYREDGLMTRRTVRSADGVDENTTEFQYNDRAQLWREIRMDIGAVTEYEYDARGRVAATINAEGNRTEISYSFDDRLVGRTRYIDGRPIHEVFDYYPDGPMRRSIDPLNRTDTWEHNARFRTIARIDPLWNRWESTLDPYGLMLSETDPTGRSKFHVYDKRGRLIAVRNDLPSVAEYRYDLADRLLSFTDGEGNTTGYEYDGRGQRVSVTHPDGAIQRTRYNVDGTIADETDETGLVTSYEYDALGRMIARVGPGSASEPSRRTEYSWNHLGVLESETDPTGRTIAYQLDPAGRVTGYRDSAGALTTYELDLSGAVTAVIDPTGRQIDYVYDELRRLTEVLRAGERSARYEYDDAGNLRAEHDGFDEAHEYIYDDCDRLQSEVNRLGDSRRYTYDDAGRRSTIVDYTGITAEIHHDAAGLVSGISYSDGSFLEYQYDRAGTILGAENQNERLEFRYTPRGTLESVTAAGATIQYSYDAAGRRTTLEDLATGRRTDYFYDGRGFLVGLDDSMAGFTDLNYDAAGRTTRIAAPNGVVTSTVYDAAGRVAATVVTSSLLSDPVIGGLAHVYDEAGRRLFDVDHFGGITGYDYDAHGRLAQVQYPFSGPKRLSDYSAFAEIGLVAQTPAGQTLGGDFDPGAAYAQPGGTSYQSYLAHPSGTADLIEDAHKLIRPLRKGSVAINQQVWTERFDYDAAGNRSTWRTGWGEAGYTYDPAGRLERAGGAVYDYDVAGNLTHATTTDGTTDYTYTAGNRLAFAATPATLIAYTYDALGRRSGRTAAPAANPERNAATDLTKAPAGGIHRTVYRYDGLSLSVQTRTEIDYADGGDFSLLAKSPSSDAGRYRPAPADAPFPGASAVARSVHHEVAVPFTSTGRVLSISAPFESTYLSHDLLGSVLLSTGRSSTATATYQYDAFGTTLTGQCEPCQPYRYAGKPLDPVTGLYDYGYRDYHPAVARFITADPVRDGTNWYAYVNNDPVNHVDPLGLAPRNLTDDQRAAYKTHVAAFADSATALPRYEDGPREGQDWDCADLATYIASGAMGSATGADDYYQNLTAGGAALTSIPGIHSSDFVDPGNVSFYRTADGSTDNAFDSANVETGTIGVFSNHIITVTTDRASTSAAIQTIQGHGSRNASWDSIGDQSDLDDYIGDFIGWAEIESAYGATDVVETIGPASDLKDR